MSISCSDGQSEPPAAQRSKPPPAGDGSTATAESRLVRDPDVLWMWTMDHPDGARATVGRGFDESYTQMLSTVTSPAPSGGADNGKVLQIRFPVDEAGVAHDRFTGFGVALRRRFSGLGLAPQRRLFLRYSMYLPADFNPYNGGKLLSLQSHPQDRPLYGAEGLSSADVYTDDSWWAGIMFTGPSAMTGTFPNRRYKGDADLDHIRVQSYVYAKQIEGMTMTTESVAAGQRGWNVKLRDRGGRDLHLRRGQWNTIEQEVISNDAGRANGALRMWVNGVLGLNVQSVKWAGDAHNGSATINGIHVDTFFGGPSSNATDQVLYYDDVVLSKGYVGPRRS